MPSKKPTPKPRRKPRAQQRREALLAEAEQKDVSPLEYMLSVLNEKRPVRILGEKPADFAARVALLERNLDDMTGSIKRQAQEPPVPAATPPVVNTSTPEVATPASQPAAAPPAPARPSRPTARAAAAERAAVRVFMGISSRPVPPAGASRPRPAWRGARDDPRP